MQKNTLGVWLIQRATLSLTLAEFTPGLKSQVVWYILDMLGNNWPKKGALQSTTPFLLYVFPSLGYRQIFAFMHFCINRMESELVFIENPQGNDKTQSVRRVL